MKRRRFRLAILVALTYLLSATYCPCVTAAEVSPEQHHCCPPEKDTSTHSTNSDAHVDGCQHCSLRAVPSSSGEASKAPALAPSVDVLHVVQQGTLSSHGAFAFYRPHGLAPPFLLPPLVRNARLRI